MFNLKLVAIVAMTLLLSACGKVDANPLLGYWKQSGSRVSYLQIRVNGDGYIVELTEPSMRNGNLEKNEFPAVITGNTLSIKVPFGEVTAVYKEREGTLVLNGNRIFGRTNDANAKSIIETTMKAEAAAKQLCKELQEEVRQKQGIITDDDAWNRYVETVQARRPKRCIIAGDEPRHPLFQ